MNNILFKTTDIASLAYFRVCFGILAFLDVMGMLTYYHWYKDAYNPDNFHFTYYGFQWVQPFPTWIMTLFLLSLMIAAVFIAWGRHYRAFATYYAFGFTYMFLVEKGHYLNHGYLFCMLSFVMILLPAHKAFSWDSLHKPEIRTSTIPFYPIFLLRAMMGMVYFMGGIAKINNDWLHAMPLKLWMKAKKDYFLIGPILEQEWTAWVMSYGGLFLDLFIVPLLLYKRTRWFGFFALLFFHITNVMIFKIGIFPWLSICLSALYFSPSFPRIVGSWLQQRFPIFIKLEQWWQAKEQAHPKPIRTKSVQLSSPKKAIITSLIVLFGIIHILLPLRHHTFKGDVAWTEEGHRYAWRMMLRSKRGKGYFEVKNGVTGEKKRIQPRKILLKKLYPKLYTHPDMILQFAHHLRDSFQLEWQTDSVEVYASIRCRLNGGKYQNYIDPKVDLAKEEWSFFNESTWIVPLKEENRTKYE